MPGVGAVHSIKKLAVSLPPEWPISRSPKDTVESAPVDADLVVQRGPDRHPSFGRGFGSDRTALVLRR
jgi:hypothetical protein